MNYNEPEVPRLQLFWPGRIRGLCIVVAILGFCVLGTYVANQMRENPRPMLIAVAGCALGPVGVGGFLMSFQRVLVFSDRIENRHFKFRRTLDLLTTRVFKVDNNGYTLKDSKGVKIYIYKYMVNSQQLFSELSM